MSHDTHVGPYMKSVVSAAQDDGGYLGCSFKHANLKHMTDRHASRVAGRGQLPPLLPRADTGELAMAELADG